MLKAIALSSLALIGAAANAAAQPSTPLFVEGGAMLNRDMSWGDQRIRNAGLSVAGGIRIGAKTEVRVVVDVPPGWTLTDTSDRFAGSPPVVTERITYTSRARNRSVAVLWARRMPVAGRCDLTLSAGWSSSRRVDGVTKTTLNVQTGERVDVEQSGGMGRNWDGPVFAAGAIVRISPRVSVVPEVRAIWYPAAENGNSIVRTGVNARWTF